MIGLFMMGLMLELRGFGAIFVGSSDFEFGLEGYFRRGGFGLVERLGGVGWVGHVR